MECGRQSTSDDQDFFRTKGLQPRQTLVDTRARWRMTSYYFCTSREHRWTALIALKWEFLFRENRSFLAGLYACRRIFTCTTYSMCCRKTRDRTSARLGPWLILYRTVLKWAVHSHRTIDLFWITSYRETVSPIRSRETAIAGTFIERANLFNAGRDNNDVRRGRGWQCGVWPSVHLRWSGFL